MSEDKDKHITREQLEAYLKGQLSHREAHEIERIAAHSELDAEAIEGIEQFNQMEFSRDLSALQRRFDHRRSRLGLYLRVAAVLTFLILGGGSVWMVTEQLVVKQELSLNEAIDLPGDTSEQDLLPMIPSVTDSAGEEKITLEVQKEEKVLSGESIPRPVVREAVKSKKAEIIADQSGAGASFSGAEEETDIASTAVTTAENSTDQSEVRRAADEDGPIIQLQESSELAEVVVTESLAQPATLASGASEDKDTATVKVLIQSDEELAMPEELVATRANEINRKSVAAAGVPEETDPVPVGGWSAFETYVEENKRYPEAAEANDIKGTVRLEVLISQLGEVISVEVEKGIGWGCDEEAVRLVKEGPKWLPAIQDGMPSQQKAQVKIKFP